MNAVATKHAAEPFHVLGIGLPASSHAQLSAAFPDCIFLDPDLYARGHACDLCDRLGKVVIFLYIPSIREEKWLRVSALFHTDDVKVIGVHPHANDALYDRALEAEFAGVLDAQADARACGRAALSVQRGELWFPRGYLSHRTRQAAASMSSSGLSSREEAILALLASGTTNQDIADALCVSRETVRWHLRSIYAKLGVSDRDAVYRMAKNKIASLSRTAPRVVEPMIS